MQYSPVKQLALEHNLTVLQPRSLKLPEEQAQLASFLPDLIIVSAYGMILPKAILELPPYGCWNVHASLLPRWRGASPIQMSILEGDNETGITIMQMDEGLDTGGILNIKALPISLLDTSLTLHNKLAKLGAELLIDTLNQKNTNTLNPPLNQEEPLACYAPKIKKEEGKINWHQPSKRIDQLIRAFNPWPCAYTSFKNTMLKIHTATLLPNTIESTTQPGTIIQSSKEGLDVRTSDGAIRISEMQFPGKKKMPYREILNAKHDFFIPGEQFE